MKLRHLLCLLLLTGISLLPCVAQAGETVTLQFLSFPKSIDPQPVELLIGDGKTIEVEIPTNALSQPYEVSRLATWTVGKTEAGEDGKPAFKAFGQAESLTASKQLILLVRTGEENADGMDVIPIANDIKNFGGGMFLFMNAARVDIAGDAGGEKFVIKPGKHSIVKPKADKSGHTFHTTFYFRMGDDARPFFTSKWPVSDNARNLIFFYHAPVHNRLRMHTIRDFSK